MKPYEYRGIPMTEPTRYRCDRCKRLCWIEPRWRQLNAGIDGGPGGSHKFCEECLDEMEAAMSVAEDRIWRRKGILLSTDALIAICEGKL